MALRYYYQIDLNGQPIGGSNVALVKKPTHFGKGQKYVEYIPLAKLFPCCESGELKITSIGKPWRFYVRVSEATNLPISGTLEKRHNAPPTWRWQEVVGKYQCATQPQWNATYDMNGETSATINLVELLNLAPNELVEVIENTRNDGWEVITSADGNTDINIDSGIEDTILLQYTNGTCLFAFQLTIVP